MAIFIVQACPINDLKRGSMVVYHSCHKVVGPRARHEKKHGLIIIRLQDLKPGCCRAPSDRITLQGTDTCVLAQTMLNSTVPQPF